MEVVNAVCSVCLYNRMIPCIPRSFMMEDDDDDQDVRVEVTSFTIFIAESLMRTATRVDCQRVIRIFHSEMLQNCQPELPLTP